MSVTGEALKKELAQRWFAAQPGIRLVNAYGLTETSDDTNHEVMDRAPRRRPGPARPSRQQRARLRRRRAPDAGAAGRPRPDRLLRGLRRPRVRQRPRAHPPGVPGRPAPRRASGSTAAATTAAGCPTASWSSSAAGTPRSRSRGFRIEIGEIENTLLRVPGVRDGAVVVAERADQSKHLVGLLRRPAAARGRRPCGTGSARRCRRTWSRRPSTGARACR